MDGKNYMAEKGKLPNYKMLAMEFKALAKNSKALPKDRVLELDDGYYNMAYACHLVSNRAKYLISKDDKSIMFKNCIIIAVS